jgi:hypothetical protein
MLKSLARKLLVGGRQERLQRLENHHLGAEPAPHGAELESDDPSPDDAQALGHLGQLERAPAVDDNLPVNRNRRQRCGLGSAGKNDVLGRVFRDLAVGRRELHAPACKQPAAPVQAGDVGALEQCHQSLRHAAHDLRLALLHLREIELDSRHLDAVDFEFLARAVVQLGRLEQSLGRNAAGIQTGAAERIASVQVLPVVDAGYRQSVLAGADRGRVPGWAAADHDHVEA